MVFGFGTYPDRDVISGLFLSKSTGEDKAVKYQAPLYVSHVSKIIIPHHCANVITHIVVFSIYFPIGEVSTHLATYLPTDQSLLYIYIRLIVYSFILIHALK